MKKLILCVLLVMAPFVLAKPDRELAPSMPDLAGLKHNNYGVLTTEGRLVFIRGRQPWVGHGAWQFRADRWELVVWWIHLDSGSLATGVYVFHDGFLAGWWQYNEQISRKADGSFEGMTHPDTIYRINGSP